MYQIAEEFCQSYLRDEYEYVFSVHTDKPHLHAHIIFNSVNRIDGRKYHYKQGDWVKDIQPITNRLCDVHGLSKIELSQEFDYKSGDWKAAMIEDIDEAREESFTYDQFLSKLHSYGYGVYDSPRHKYLTLTPPGYIKEGGFKGHRTNVLGKEYGKEELQKYFSNKALNKSKVLLNEPGPDIAYEKLMKWQTITYTKYEVYYLPTADLRRQYIDYKKNKQLHRSRLDRKAYLYQREVNELLSSQKRERFMEFKHLVTISDVTTHMDYLKNMWQERDLLYKQMYQELKPFLKYINLYEEYQMATKAVEFSNSEASMKKQKKVLREIEQGLYSMKQLEDLSSKWEDLQTCYQDKKTLQKEIQMCREILDVSKRKGIDVNDRRKSLNG